MKNTTSASSLGPWGDSWPDAALRVLSTYLLPGLLGVVCLLALLAWDSAQDAQPLRPLTVHAFIDDSGQLGLPQAVERLRREAPALQFNTHLSEKPVWFSVDLLAPLDHGTVIELPSRHLVAADCWDLASKEELGHRRGRMTDRNVALVKSGTVVHPIGDGSIVCRGLFEGPARLTALSWSPQALELSAGEFARNSGLMDGGIIVLAAFVLVTALLLRQRIYLIFGVWLILGLRVGSTSFGWDEQWLGHVVPEHWLATGRSVTMASYALLTLALFRELFKAELTRTRFDMPIRVIHWLCIPLLVASFTLPRSIFIPTVWFVAGPGLILMTLSLGAILIRTQSHVAIWYGASLAVTFVSGIAEIVAAASGSQALAGIFNGVTSVLAASLLASLAIAAQMRQEHLARLEAQAQLQNTFDAVPIGMFTLDLQGQFTRLNPELRRMLGTRVQRGAHHTWQQCFGANLWRDLLEMVQNHPDGEMEMRSQLDVTGMEPARRFLVKAVLAGDRIEGSLQDVTDKSIAAEEISFLADNDALTKVLNRRGIEKAFYEALANAQPGSPVALAYLDLDRFKLINDLFGHNAGDEVLRQVCQRMGGMLGPQMKLGRVGGDEFVIVLPDTRMALAGVIARGLIDQIEGLPFRVGDKAFNVLASLGLIEVTPGSQFKEALSSADRACREAKEGGSGGVVIYEQGSPAFKEHQAELQLIEELSASADIPGLYLEMQPIMSLSHPTESLNFEVLLRMRKAAGQEVPVHRVISAAENSGRMSAIDRWVLTSTLQWLDAHQDRLDRTRFVCMNLSGASLNDEEFMQEVFRLLRLNSHVTRYLTVEITESIALHDLKNTRRFIDRVRELGARVALDDFGAGYTSFSYLKELPADLLKIDGSFIVNMNQHPANVSIVEAIVNLARNLGMKTIAEWAEDTATVQTLVEIGVDYVQGYAVARPMAPDRILSARSGATFIQDAELQRLVETLDRQNDPLTQLDLLGETQNPPTPKIH